MKEIIITSSVLILCIMLIRVVFRGKISSRLQYALWLLVALRLMIPATAQIYMAIGSVQEFRIMDLVEMLESRFGDVTEQLETPVSLPMSFAMSTDNTWAGRVAGYVLGETLNLSGSTDGPTSVFVAGKIGFSLLDIFRGIWGGGMIIMALWMLITNIIFSRRLHKGRKEFLLPESVWSTKINLPQDEDVPGIEDDKISRAVRKAKIYTIEGLASPCLYGLPFRESIYLTADIAEDPDRLRHVLTHEMCHKKHGDSFWSIVRSILLIVYWMNPLVWVAAVLSKRDCELACDEEALLLLGEEERISYGETLLSIITRKSRLSDIACTATTMTGSGKSVKERIKFIADKPRVLGAAVVAALVLVIVVSVLVFTKNPLFHGNMWEGALTLITGDMQIRLPETIAGISGYETDRDDNVIIYQASSGEEVGRFCTLSYGEAVLLIEQGREVVPLGNYGRNPYLRQYMLSITPSSGYETTTHTYTPYTPSNGEGVPGTDSNIGGAEGVPGTAGIIAHEDMYSGEDMPDEMTKVTDDDTTYILEEGSTDNSMASETDLSEVTISYEFDELAMTQPIEYLPNEEIIVVNRPITSEISAASARCYIYVKGDYSGVKDEYISEMDYINSELEAVTEQVIVLSINRAVREEMIEALAANRTEYLGEAYKVVALVSALPQPDGLQYVDIAIHTLQTDPETGLSLDVNYRQTATDRENVDEGAMYFNAVMLFATIKNLDTCNFVISPAEGSGNEIVTYDRADLEEVFGPLWSDEAAESQEDYGVRLKKLYHFVILYLDKGSTIDFHSSDS
ncbi:MAG: DUF4825 domain-containing protein [Lachnospiraceae bacterium]|nr:DUF4825 domain-containing protein [Lachnospiraceae bacterium]